MALTFPSFGVSVSQLIIYSVVCAISSNVKCNFCVCAQLNTGLPRAMPACGFTAVLTK